MACPKAVQKTFFVALYLRKSKEEDDSRSVHNQESALKRELERIIEKDSDHRYVYTDTYCDEDYTGTDSERPDFQRLLRDLGTGRVNMLLVTELSRLSRNIAESLNYLQCMFVALNVRFISLQLPQIDSYLNPDRIYNLEIPMQSMMNESHCLCTSLAIRRTFQMLREKGEFIGAFCGYGYKKSLQDRHKLILDEEPVRVMKMIRDWLFEGKSPANIYRLLNDLGIPNPTGYKAQQGLKFSPACGNPTYLWSAQTVRYVMSREALIGVMVQGKSRVISYKVHKQIQTPEEEWFRVKDVIPRIFTDEEFAKIQECLNRTTRSSPNGSKREVSLFAGFLKCADCKRTVSLKRSGNFCYYVCNTHKNYNACSSHSIREDKLISAVLAAIRQQISVAVNLQEVLKEWKKSSVSANRHSHFDGLIEKNQKEIDKIAAYKQSLYQDWKDGEITKEEYRSMKAAYADREQKVQLAIENLRKEKEKSEKETEKSDPFLTSFFTDQKVHTLSRDMLISLIDHIDVHENKKITIHFKFSDAYQSIFKYSEDRKNLPA